MDDARVIEPTSAQEGGREVTGSPGQVCIRYLDVSVLQLPQVPHTVRKASVDTSAFTSRSFVDVKVGYTLS